MRPLTLSCRFATDWTWFCPRRTQQWNHSESLLCTCPSKKTPQTKAVPQCPTLAYNKIQQNPEVPQLSSLGCSKISATNHPTVQACRHNDITIPLQGPILCLRFHQVVFPRHYAARHQLHPVGGPPFGLWLEKLTLNTSLSSFPVILVTSSWSPLAKHIRAATTWFQL